MRVICSVGTTHPWNIAGIGLDARVCARLNARQLAVVAGVSAQGGGTAAHEPVSPALIAEQLRSVARTGVGAYRIGALLSAQSVRAVADGLADTPAPVVCDPVFVTSGGQTFADEATIEALHSALFPRCALVTPNLSEASRLCGFPVNDRATMAMAAQALVERCGAKAALVTGGHLEDEATDMLYADGRSAAFSGTRLEGGMRGTGCVLAATIAIHLANGAELSDAIERARLFVRYAISHAIEWNGERVWPW